MKFEFSRSVAVVAILIAALVLRLYGLSFGLPALNDSDELMFEMGAMRMLGGATLNPGWFGHPATITMYVLAIVNAAVFAIGYLIGWYPDVASFGEALYADPTPAILPGRAVMALFGVGTIALTYQLARSLFGHATGIAAAALLAVNPIHILYSQVIRSDIMAIFFMLLCMLAAVRIAREDRGRDYVLASLWLALAVASKWPFAVVALGIASAGALRLIQHPATRRRQIIRLALFGLLSLVFLILISPYLLIDHAKVIANLQGEAQARHLGATGGSPLWNAWWYIRQPILGGLGVAGLAFLGWGAWLSRRRSEAVAIVAPVAVGFFVLIIMQNLVWVRWSLPLMPLLSLLAAAGLTDLIRRLWTRWNGHCAAAAMTIIALVTVAPLVLQAQANAHGRLDDSRQRASMWARAHIPPGSVVLLEHFALDLVGQPWRFLFPLGDLGCVDARAYLHSKVGYSTIEQARGNRSNVDFGTVAPERAATCQANYAILTQYDRYRAERTTFPHEYAAYAALLDRGRIVATFQPHSGNIIFEPVVRIVHFSRPPGDARNAELAPTFSQQDMKSAGERNGRDRARGPGAGRPIL